MLSKWGTDFNRCFWFLSQKCLIHKHYLPDNFSFSSLWSSTTIYDYNTKGGINVCWFRLLSILISILIHLSYTTECYVTSSTPSCLLWQKIYTVIFQHSWIRDVSSDDKLSTGWNDKGKYAVQQIFLSFHLRIHFP